MPHLFIGDKPNDLRSLGVLPPLVVSAAEKVFARIRESAPADLDTIRVRTCQIVIREGLHLASAAWGTWGYTIQIHPLAVEQLSEVRMMGLLAHEFGHIVHGHGSDNYGPLTEAQKHTLEKQHEAEADQKCYQWGLSFERMTLPASP